MKVHVLHWNPVTLLLAALLIVSTESPIQAQATASASGIQVSSVTPSTVSYGDTITITGSAFSTKINQDVVKFAGPAGKSIQAAVQSATRTTIKATVPKGAITGTVTVRIGGTTSNGVTVTVNAPNPAPAANLAPIVNAGLNQTVTLPASANLTGTATDDALPTGSTLTTKWSAVSGPGAVTFGNANSLSTVANFSTSGSYVLRLTASDGALSSTSDVSITVNPAPNQAPTVSASSPQTITLPASANLSGTASDDGIPRAVLTTTWSKVSGPAMAFGNAHSLTTVANFSTSGSYVLRLTASDGALSSTSDVSITVNPAPNQAPTVSASSPQTITLPASANLSGTASDDGLPSGVLTTTWSAVSGPGAVTFGNANSLSTVANFSTSGSYVLRLTASDGQLSSISDVSITVNPVSTSLSIDTASVPNGAVGSAYPATTLTASGGTPAYTWSLTSGSNLPPGLTLSNAGVISGTPTIAGNYSFSVQATDSAQITGAKAFSMSTVSGTLVQTGADPITNGNNFQAAINNAKLGDTILLTAGATYFSSGGFSFGPKSGGTGTDADYITVQSSNMAGCPAAGIQVDPPIHAAAMPKLVGSGPPVISVNVRAHHWKFVCLEVTNDQMNYSSSLITTSNNGSQTGGYATFADVMETHDITFDRLFVHNPEVTANNLHPQALEIYAGRGIALSGVNLSVLNSWIGSFAGYFPGTTTLTDSYGIVGGLGGPILVKNNRIEGFFNNIFWAASGVDPDHTGTISSPTLASATLSSVNGLIVGDLVALEVPGGTNGCSTNFNNPRCWQTVQVDSINGTTLTYHGFGTGALTATPLSGGIAQWNGIQPTNITTTRNYLYKNPWWQQQWPGGAKDYIEVKTCISCSYTANTFAGACAASIAFEVAQTGSNGGHPWNTIVNNIFQNNLLLGDANGVFMPLGGAQAYGSFTVSNVPGHDIVVTNNLWQNVVSSCGNNPSTSGWLQTAGGYNVTVTHNTIRNLNTVNPVFNSAGSGIGQTNLIVKDNIFNYGPSGFNYNSPGGYKQAWPSNGIIEQKNVVIANGALTNNPGQPGEVPNSYRTISDAEVLFVNVVSADAGGDYHGYALFSTSPFKGRASDGRDPGVDFTTLDGALSVR